MERTMVLRTGCFIFSLALMTSTFQGQEKKTLSAEDEKLLQRLLGDFLFDPKGAERAQAEVRVRFVWAAEGREKTQAWVKFKGADYVYLADGARVLARVGEKIDFVAVCKTLYAQAPDKTESADARGQFAQKRREALGNGGESDLIVAAWLYRLGEKNLAANALARVDDREQEIANVRKGLAWTAFAGMVHAYMVRADDEALDHGERLMRLFEAETKDQKQAGAIIRDLKRRKELGIFGKGQAKTLPEDFAKWETKKQIAHLIEVLQDVDARQQGQPGGVHLAGDFRVAALIKIGEPAVPALIDALENDARLTRSVHFWRDFSQSRTVLSVRETALTALMSILRVRVFETRSTGDNFTSRGEEGAKEAAKKLREYWKEFGPLTFDERMMKVLTDGKSSFEATREAADNLANLGAERTFGTTVWTDTASPRPKGPNPAVKKFSGPTAAEAILAAMDRDLSNHDGKARDFLHDFQRRRLEDQYLFPLIALGDTRIAGELAKRAGAEEAIRMRRKWAYGSFHLGNSEPIKKYADDFAAGKIKLPANDRPQTNDFDQPGYVELRGIVTYLGGVKLPEADRALFALADRKHPDHGQAAKAVLAGGSRFEQSGWASHPYCLTILRAALDDDKTRENAVKRLESLVSGLPRGDVKEIKEYLDRHRGKFRLATDAERKVVGGSPWEPRFVTGDAEASK